MLTTRFFTEDMNFDEQIAKITAILKKECLCNCETVYAEKYRNITILCPFKSQDFPLQWNGPKKLRVYADNEKINPKIRGIGITGDNDNGEYNLVIYNFNKSNEGNYKCSTVQNGTAVQQNFELTLEHGKPRVSGGPIPTKAVTEKIPVSSIHTTDNAHFLRVRHILPDSNSIEVELNITCDSGLQQLIVVEYKLSSIEYWNNEFNFTATEANCYSISIKDLVQGEKYDVRICVVTNIIKRDCTGVFQADTIAHMNTENDNASAAEFHRNAAALHTNDRQNIRNGLKSTSRVCGGFLRQPDLQPKRNEGKEQSELNYIEIEFKPQSDRCKYYIHGTKDKTEYSEIDFEVIAEPLPSSESEIESDDENDPVSERMP
ncbi:Hypothetical predicted protein [Mytilus galloprovincialis]|uniref:Immunoglobulin domain-containing protein n=1 Tax=Mytilus galloprovincialis TaxID=29158 RepID=A0A8B6BVB2_MYTGA|nr:Hypothetical predicted protein [Mytilus galloprovincialis]